MRFVSVRDLSSKPRKVWGLARQEEVVVTSNGKPIAVLSGVTEETLERTLRAIRRSRAILALEEMQKRSVELGLDKMTESEIEAEIRSARSVRRR